MNESESSTSHPKFRLMALLGGPIAALAVYLVLGAAVDGSVGDGLSEHGRRTACVMVWMSVWWLAEAVPLPVTSLLPMVLLPGLGIGSFEEASSPYAGRVIYLFLGGFLLALGMERWGLHKRIALVTVRLVGTSPKRLIGGFMLATAVMSMWMSNTATTIMMVPIGLSVIGLVGEQSDSNSKNFGICLLLGIAYAASIGGVATPIGTPPNTFLVQFLHEEGRSVSFLEWMTVGLPVVAVFLPITWLLLTRVTYPIRMKSLRGGREMIGNELHALGRVNRGEWIVMGCFGFAVVMWLVRGLAISWEPERESLTWIPEFFGTAIDDSTIAIVAAVLLFAIPVRLREGVFALSWEDARRVPWGILILFGGGLSLAKAAETSGLSAWIGAGVSGLEGVPTIVLVICVATIVVFLTEVTSNTATASIFLPILFGVAVTGLGIDPLMLLVPTALGASCAFMMPVATPPNAIVFSSGHITIRQMATAGILLNILSIIIVTIATYTVVIWFLGATPDEVPSWVQSGVSTSTTGSSAP